MSTSSPKAGRSPWAKALGFSALCLLTACSGSGEAEVAGAPILDAPAAGDDPYVEARALFEARAKRVARAEAGR
jgi:hypothetical protein